MASAPPRSGGGGAAPDVRDRRDAPLDFGDDSRLETLSRRWARTLYALVEIENAHRLDTSILAEPLSCSEQAGALERTPHRLQFAVEAHRRFLGQTEPVVCRGFGRLWQATSDVCPVPGGGPALVDELGSVLAGPAATAARARVATSWS